MKKIVFLTAIFFISLNVFSQLKIGNNPTTINSNSILELESTNKGLLIPRVALQSTDNAAPLSSFVAGMMIYNTATAGDVTPGFYVSTGSSWTKIDNQTSTTLYNGNGAIPASTTRAVTFGSGSNLNFDANTLYVDGDQSRVGIGTALPSTKLDVTGGQIRIDTDYTLTINRSDNFTHNSKSMSHYGIGWFGDSWDNSGGTAWLSGYAGLKFFSNGTARMYITRGGNVGIGNASPSEKLDVTGNIRFSGALMPNNLAGTSGQVLTSAGSGAVPTWTTLAAASTLYSADGSIPASTTRAVSFGSASNLNFDGNTLYIDGDNSRIGIGTNSPTMVLNVKSTTADALKIENSGAATTTAGVSNIAMINNNSTVGNYTSITSRTSANGYASAIEFINVSHTAPTGDIRFVLNNAGSYGERLRITAAGNLGIGKADPSEKLDVAGNVRFSGALLPNNLAGTSGQVLTSAGAGNVPTWTTLPTATTYSGSTSITLNSTSFERAALTGDVTASANSNATTIATGAVTSAKILDGTIATADIATGAVTSTTILDGTIAIGDVANDAISFAKMQNIATNKLLGRGTASTGDIEEITLGTGLSLTGTTLNAETATTLYSENGTLAGNRSVTQGTNTLAFTSTATSGTSHFTVDGTTLNIDAANNRVGIGTATPSAVSHIYTNSSTLTNLVENALATNYAMTAYKASAKEYRIGTGGASESLFGVQSKFFIYDVSNNAMRMVIDETGNVGLGINAPVTKLDIATGVFKVGDASGYQVRTGPGYIDFYDIAGTKTSNIAQNNTNADLYINGLVAGKNTVFNHNNSGKVGIGNNSPSEKLDVIGNIKFSGALMPNNLAGTSGQVLTSAGAGNVPTWTTLPTATTYSGSTSITLNGTSFERAALTGDVTASANSNATTIATGAVTSAKILDGTIATGDIATGAVTTTTILDGTIATGDVANDAISFAKMQNIATNKLLGRGTASTGDIEEITLGTGLSFSGTTLNAATGNTLYTADGTLSGNRNVTQGTNTLAFTSSATTGTSHFTVDGTTLNVDAVNNRIGIGTATPTQRFTVVGGSISPAVGNASDAGIYFPANPGGGSGDEAFIRYYAETGENTKLMIGNSNDTDDDISFFQGGAERLTIFNGNIGVGTTAPEEKMHINVAGSNAVKIGNVGNANGALFLGGGGTSGVVNWIDFYNASGTKRGNVYFDQTNGFVVNNTGSNTNIGGTSGARLGINTYSPTSTLDVDGGILARGNNSVSNQGAHLQWNRSASEGETWLLNQKGGGGSNAGIRFGSVTTSNATTEWARFVDNGSFSVDGSTFSVDAANNRVGIGTSSPQRSFDIAGTNATMAVIAGENESATIGLGTNNSSSVSGAVKTAIIAQGVNSWSRAKLHFALNDNGSSNSSTESATVSHARMTIQSDGNVGIGTTSPTSRLNVTGGKITIDGNQTLTVNPTDNFSYDSKSMSHYGLGWFNDTWNGGGSTAWLSGYAGVKIFTSGQQRISVDVGGACSNTTGSWSAFSDARIKTVKSEFKDGLAVIKQINPVRFVYNENAPFKSKDVQIGIVAQDLEKVAPYMVTKTDNGEIQDLREVNSQAYVFLLINAVKEQQAQIEEMKKEIEELKKDKR